jgi:hypothetical protein
MGFKNIIFVILVLIILLTSCRKEKTPNVKNITDIPYNEWYDWIQQEEHDSYLIITL